ncbi:cytoskeleton-associated protein 2-like [Rhinoraja longicauda]
MASAGTAGRPHNAMSYQEQKEQKLEELRQRKRYANSVAEQARCRLDSRICLKDKTNFDKDRAAKWRQELPAREGKPPQPQPKVPVPHSSVPQPPSGGESTVSGRPEEASRLRGEGATAEPREPANQIARSKTVPSSTAPDNQPNAGQRAEGNVQQAEESERKPPNQKPDSVAEQTGKMQDRQRKATLSRSFLALRSEQAQSLASRSGRPRLPLPAFKTPAPGSFRGRIVESKVQSFWSTSQQSARPGVAATTRSDTEVRAKVPRAKPMSKGVVSRPAPGRRANAALHGNPRGSPTVPGRQKPATTSVLNIKIDFSQAGNGDAAIVATQTISKKSIAPPLKTPRDTSRPPAWNVTKHQGSLNTIKRTAPTTEKRRTEPVSKGRPVKRSDLTPLPKKKPVAEPVKSLWTTIMEEENQSELVNKINQTLSQCLNRIQEGCPSADVLQTLETFVERVPKAKKFARYWICLAYLEQRKGLVHDVMAVYERAVRSGAQPAEELRNTLADVLRNTKTPKKPCRGEGEEDGADADATLPLDSTSERAAVEGDMGRAGDEGESVRAAGGMGSASPQRQGLPCPGAAGEPSLCGDDGGASEGAEPTAAVKEERCTRQWMESAARHGHGQSEQGCWSHAEGDSKENCKFRTIKIEDLKTPIKQIMTPSKGKNRGSSVKYNVKATPKLKSTKNPVHQDNCSSDIKDLRYLTPVRRSRRIEQGSEQLPSMLQDHDPCISSLNDLRNLAGGTTAYMFKMNNALQEFTNISMD